MKKIPSYLQTESKDCGPTSLKIMARYYRKNLNIKVLRSISETTRAGSNLLMLSDAAKKIGFRTLGVKLSLEQIQGAPLPCIFIGIKIIMMYFTK